MLRAIKPFASNALFLGDGSPDGQHIVTNNGELWDLALGEVIRRYPPGDDLVLHPADGSFFITIWNPIPAVVQWRLDSLDQLVTWTLDNRIVRELTCDERALYQLAPLCDDAGRVPTRTPYPTALPTAAIIAGPALDLSGPTSVVTPTPSVTPHPQLIAIVGENRGEVAVGDGAAAVDVPLVAPSVFAGPMPAGLSSSGVPDGSGIRAGAACATAGGSACIARSAASSWLDQRKWSSTTRQVKTVAGANHGNCRWSVEMCDSFGGSQIVWAGPVG